MSRLTFLLLTLSFGCCDLAADDVFPSHFSISTFSADVTIPLGHRCMGILPTKSTKVADPLYAHGFVLNGPMQPVVLCAVDWCEIRNGAYDQWREALAKAAGTTRERVLVTSLHQHDAPVTDSGAAQLLAEVGLQGELYDEPFHDRTVARVAEMLRLGLQKQTPVTHIGLGEATVQDIASNRRVMYPNGKVAFNRGSRSGEDEFHRGAPAGLIDPKLKSISFWSGDKPIVVLHAYATHPMSHYGAGEISSDFVGLARDRRQRDDFSVRQIYVSGCSGDVTAGKFNDGSRPNRWELVDRLYQGMVDAWANTRREPLEKIDFRSTHLDLEFSGYPSLTQANLEQELRDESASERTRILAAMSLSSRSRVTSGQSIDVPCLDLGHAQIVLFPGEAFVGYQLMAQQMRPDSFVLSIGYGECWPGYIPTKAAFDDGFHDTWLWVERGSQAKIRSALNDVLLVE